LINKPNSLRSPVLQLKVISPLNLSVDFSELVFLWKELNAEYYVIEIFNNEAELIWKSDKVNNNTFTPSKNLMKYLEKKSVYFWMVYAHFPDGKIIKSKLSQFNLK